MGDHEFDQPELKLSAKMTAGAAIGPDLYVAEFQAGVRVFFDTQVWIDLNDLPEPQSPAQLDYVYNVLEGGYTPEVPQAPFTYDGRVRLNELALAYKANPVGVINASGALYAGLEAFVFASVGFGPFKIVLLYETFTLVQVNVYDFNIYQLSDADLLGRPSEDLDDVRGVILAQGGNLDVTRIRDRLRQIEAALDQSDLSPVFEAQLKAARAPKR